MLGSRELRGREVGRGEQASQHLECCYTLYTIFISFGCFSQDNLVVFLCLNTTDLDTTNFFCSVELSRLPQYSSTQFLDL